MENKVIGLNDFGTVCRICLDKKGNLTSIFEKSLLPNLIKTYREMLEECASVHISTDDSLPKNICFECVKYLEQCYKFKIQYLTTEKLLEQIIANAQTNIKIETSNDENDDFKNEDSVFDFYHSDEIPQSASVKKEFISIKEEIIKETNRETNENNLQDYSTIQKYKCEECEIRFQLKAEFYKHQKLVHSKILKCMFCDKTFKFTYNLKKHSPEVVRCKICKQTFGCKGNLRDHLLEHATCKICGKSFKSVRLCNYHLKIHGEKCHLCTYCGKAFTDRGNYTVHVRTHTGEKRYQCTQCDAKFVNSDGLRKHCISHSDERKFKCEICKRTYKRQETLISHRRIHMEGEIYSCDICNKQFKRKDTLRAHQKVHTGERNYVCSFCDKAFMKSDNLKMHLRTHTGEKPFTCSKCGKKFSQKHVLNSHMKTHFETAE